MAGEYEEKFSNAEKSLKRRDLAGAKLLFNDAKEEYRKAGSPSLTAELFKRFNEFQVGYFRMWLEDLESATADAVAGLTDKGRVLAYLNDFVDEFRPKNAQLVFKEPERSDIKTRVQAMRSLLDTKTAVPTTIVDSDHIDLSSWPEAEHPDLVKKLKAFTDTVTVDLGTNLRDSLPYVEGKLIEVNDLFRKIESQVLDLGNGVFNKKNNKAEVVEFLRDTYVKPAKTVESNLFSNWDRLISAEPLIVTADAKLALVVSTLSLPQVRTELPLIPPLLADLKANATRSDYNQSQQTFFADKAVKLEAFLTKLKDRKSSIIDAESKDIEFADWQTKIKPLVDFLNKVDAIDETKIKPASVDPLALDNDEVVKLERELQQLKVTHTQELSKSKYHNNSKVLEELRDLQGENGDSGRMQGLMQKINRMLKESEKKKPVKDLTYAELIAELWPQDSTEQSYGRGKTEGREKELVIAFNQTKDPMKEGATEEERLENLSLKYHYLLKCMDVYLYKGDGEAAGNRKLLFEPVGNDGPAITKYGLDRKELLMASTHHPLWGEETRRILRWLIEETAKEAHEIEPGLKLTYDTIAAAKGKENLDKVFAKFFPNPTGDKLKQKAKDFAKLLFSCFDMPTIILQERQHLTRTRNHNQGLDMIDPISMQEPLAAYIHAESRYGGNKKDWRAWWLVYLKEIPDNSKYGAKGHAEEIREVQRMVKLSQHAYMPTEAFAGTVDLPGFCQSVFPDTYDLVTLGNLTDYSEEKISMMGKTFDKDGHTLGTSIDTEISPFAAYQTAYLAWNELLKLTYQGIPDKISKEAIMEQVKEGGKGGLLSLWVQEAGKAKIFYPKHLKVFLEPMLTHYVYRLIAQFTATADFEETKELVHEIIGALKHTGTRGGLSAFPEEIEKVIEHIEHDIKHNKLLINPLYARKKQRNEYLDEWWPYEFTHKDEHGHEVAPPRPPIIGGISLKFDMNKHERHFLDMKRELAPLELPVQRNGSMIQEKEKSSGH